MSTAGGYAWAGQVCKVGQLGVHKWGLVGESGGRWVCMGGTGECAQSGTAGCAWTGQLGVPGQGSCVCLVKAAGCAWTGQLCVPGQGRGSTLQ